MRSIEVTKAYSRHGTGEVSVVGRKVAIGTDFWPEIDVRPVEKTNN